MQNQNIDVPGWMRIVLPLPGGDGTDYYRSYNDPMRGAVDNVCTLNSWGAAVAGGRTSEHPKFFDVPKEILRQIVQLGEAVAPQEYKENFGVKRDNVAASFQLLPPQWRMEFWVKKLSESAYQVSLNWKYEKFQYVPTGFSDGWLREEHVGTEPKHLSITLTTE